MICKLETSSSSPLMKPHLNSLDPDVYLDQHQIAHTRKFQSLKNAIKIHAIPKLNRFFLSPQNELDISWVAFYIILFTNK